MTEFVERCEDKRYFAFDGDDLHVSSFTMQMVMHAALKLKNGVDINIIAFRNDREIDGLRASWHQKIIDINVADLSKSAIVSANPSIPLESTVMKLKMIVVMLPSALTPLDNDYYAYHGLTGPFLRLLFLSLVTSIVLRLQRCRQLRPRLCCVWAGA